MLQLYKKRTNKTQYVKMNEAFRKIYLQHQALYKEPDDVHIFYKKHRSFYYIKFFLSAFYIIKNKLNKIKCRP